MPLIYDLYALDLSMQLALLFTFSLVSRSTDWFQGNLHVVPGQPSSEIMCSVHLFNTNQSADVTKSLKSSNWSRNVVPIDVSAYLVVSGVCFKFGPRGLILQPLQRGLVFEGSRCAQLMKCAELQMLCQLFNPHSSSSCLAQCVWGPCCLNFHADGGKVRSGDQREKIWLLV